MLIQDKIQPGSIKGSIFNIIISTVGGILSLPFGVGYIGLAGGILMVIASGILSFYSNDLQLVVCEHMNPNVKPSFKTMSELAGGKCLATFTQVVLLIQMFGAFVSYQVASGGLIDLCFTVVTGSHYNIYTWAVLIMTFAIMYPLGLLNSMAKLRFTSFFYGSIHEPIVTVIKTFLGLVIMGCSSGVVIFSRISSTPCCCQTMDINQHST